MSSRCEVTLFEDYVLKRYKVAESYQQEKETYTRLSDKTFIPKMIEFDDSNKTIKLQRINALTLDKFVFKNYRLPYNLARDFKRILSEMAEVGIVDTPDFYKFEHIFVMEDEKIIVIDFDVNIAFPLDNPSLKELVDRRKSDIEREYSFLTGDVSAWNDFKQMLYSGGISKVVVDDFYQNMLK